MTYSAIMSRTDAIDPQLLTSKGQATRRRILEHAAELIYTRGVHATNNEQLRRAAQVSGSQLNHYFPTKESLVRAVIDWQAEKVLSLHRSEQFSRFETVEAFRAWADFYIGYERAHRDGCTLGSLTSEIIKADLDVQQELAGAFEQWRTIFRDGIEHLQQRGRMSADADPTQLANLLLSAFQGGMLLAQVARDIGPLRDALNAAVDHLTRYATEPDDSRSDGTRKGKHAGRAPAGPGSTSAPG